MPERVMLAIGTKKGLFVAEASKSRGSFALRGPFGSGVAVYSTLVDTRALPPDRACAGFLWRDHRRVRHAESDVHAGL